MLTLIVILAVLIVFLAYFLKKSDRIEKSDETPTIFKTLEEKEKAITINKLNNNPRNNKRKEKCAEFYKEIKEKGKKEEKEVSDTLNSLAVGTVYDDIYIPKRLGGNTQLDHILVSRKGIFVIETKNYSGVLKGNEDAYELKYVTHKSSNSIYNPILQNESHRKHLALYLNLPEHYIIPIEVIADTCEIQVNIKTSKIINTKDLTNCILTYQRNLLSESDVNNVKNKLDLLNKTKKTDKDEHLTYMRALNQIKNTKCPKCNHELVVKTGSRGQFIGCTNYPDCKFTKPLND